MAVRIYGCISKDHFCSILKDSGGQLLILYISLKELNLGVIEPKLSSLAGCD